jgi:hypothetical protein
VPWLRRHQGKQVNIFDVENLPSVAGGKDSATRTPRLLALKEDGGGDSTVAEVSWLSLRSEVHLDCFHLP